MRKKSQKKKNRTRKFILLLFLTIIMLGTSTYAWFTANQVVTIQSISVNVQATNGIQISTDAENWKSVITNADIRSGYTNHTNQLPSSVTAVSTNGKYTTTTGKLKMYLGTVGNNASTGNYNITTAVQTDTAGNTGAYVAFDVFLRLDTDQTIYITGDSGVVAGGSPVTDKGLKNAARVAFIKYGTTTATDTPANMIGLTNGLATTDTNANAIIWEPNCSSHEQLALDLADEYDVTLPAANAEDPCVTYWGVNKTIGTAVDLKELVNGTNTTDADQMSPQIKTEANNTAAKSLMNLTAGVTKLRIYMWIEGQDIDCENGATGSDIIYNLKLSTTNA